MTSTLWPPGTGAALLLYARLPSLRGNFWWLVAAGAMAMAGWNVPHLIGEIHKHGVSAALYSRDALQTWWMGGFYAAAAVTSTYWGRVGSNLAPMMPSLLAAERMAAAIVVIGLELLLAAPLVVLGAAPASALALAALSSCGGFGFGRGATATGQGRGRQGIQTLVFLPLLFVGALDPVMRAIGTAPGWITLPIAVLVVGTAISALQFRPAEARDDQDRSDTLMAAWAARRPAAAPPRLTRWLDWRPAPLRDQPLPPGPFNPGTLMVALLTFAVLLVGLALGWIISLGTGHGPSRNIQALLGSAAAIPVLGASTWLLSRGEWTRIFVAGRYGSRHAFAGALVRAHLWRTAQLGVITALVLGAMLVILRLDTPRDGVLRAAVTGALILGTCQLGCLFAMATGLSKLWTGVGNFGGMMLVNIAAATLLKHGWPPVWYGVTAACTLVAAGLVWGLGPVLLQRADWTPEEPGT